MKLTLLLTLFSAASAMWTCPTTTTLYDDKCYGYLGTEFPYNTAGTLCQSTYGYCTFLPAINNKAENDFLATQTQKRGVLYTWLQYRANGVYYVDNYGNPPAYTKWAIGEPFSSATGYCATIGLNGYWYAQPCANSMPTICQLTETCPGQTTTTVRPPVTASPGYPTCLQKYLNFVPCAYGWTYYPPACACYKIIENMSYSQASTWCSANQATLASVHNSGQAAFIQSLAVQDQSSWPSTATYRDNVIVGLYSNGTNLFWEDGSYFDYPQGFAPGEPSSISRLVQGQIIINVPVGFATYMRMADCNSYTCRYAACQRLVY